MEILDQYTTSAPSIQNTIDIFKGEWSSKLPADLGELRAGEAGLFEDGRIYWAAEQLSGFQGKTVLELGPLEAGHTYVMEQLGASSITAVEANSRAYLKCLLVKEILGMNRSHFVYGDCIEFLQGNQQPFDVCVASGILYHMRNPAKLIALLAKTCNQLFVWTHYYDSNIITNNPNLQPRFSLNEPLECDGFHHQLYRQEYQTALGWGGFCGGSATYSRWMNRDDILACCRHFGFQDIRISFDHPNHPNGPCFAFVALKEGAVPVTDIKPDADLLKQNNLSASIQADYHHQIHQLQQQLHRLKTKSEQLEQQFQTAQERIVAMETSKFWKLRKSWFQFKQIFHLPSNE
jgi:hypothetical protein